MTTSTRHPSAADPPIRTDIPYSARIWNYWMGGTDYNDIGQIASDAATASYPDITTMMVQSRQFLDIGAGMPVMVNTHDLAQAGIRLWRRCTEDLLLVNLIAVAAVVGVIALVVGATVYTLAPRCSRRWEHRDLVGGSLGRWVTGRRNRGESPGRP